MLKAKVIEVVIRRRHGWFTLGDIESLKLIPWARNGRTIRRLIEADAIGRNVLQAKISGEGSRRSYLVRPKRMAKYLLTYGPAMMATVRNTKEKTYANKDGRKAKGKGGKDAAAGR